MYIKWITDNHKNRRYKNIIFYQPVINIFITLSIINIFFPIIKSQAKYHIIYLQAFLCFLSSTIYYLLIFLLSPIKPIRSEKITFAELPHHFINNINNLYDILNSFYFGIIPVIVCLLVFILLWIIFSWRKNNKILVLLSPFTLFIFIWGPLLFLKEEMVFPRTYVTIGIIFGLLFLFISLSYKYLFTFSYVFLAFSYFIMFSFNFSYIPLSISSPTFTL